MISLAEIDGKRADFVELFGEGGGIEVYFAPGRVNIIGEHTDYNGGLVLPIAIQQGTCLMIRPSSRPAVRIHSSNLEGSADFDPRSVSRRGDWADYVGGIYRFAAEKCPDMIGFDGLFFGDLMLEAGLSSSASLELVTAMGLETLGCTLSREEAVRLSRKAENDFVGVSCGVMDQFAVAFARKGHAVLLDCSTLEHTQVPFNIHESTLVIGYTGVSRTLSSSQYNRRKAECEQALDIMSEKLGQKDALGDVTIEEFESVRSHIEGRLGDRAEHVVYENQRVRQAETALREGDGDKLGRLMNLSHESLRDLYEVSSPQLDAIQEISLRQPGVLGCRMTGAGFGGCVIALVHDDSLDEYLDQVPGIYEKRTGLKCELAITAPGEGARKLGVSY